MSNNDRLAWLLHLIAIRDTVIMWAFVVTAGVLLSHGLLRRGPFTDHTRRVLLDMHYAVSLAAWVMAFVLVALLGGNQL